MTKLSTLAEELRCFFDTIGEERRPIWNAKGPITVYKEGRILYNTGTF